MIRILFVCRGNSCRSPMARMIFARKAGMAGLCVEADSAGTFPMAEGSPISQRAAGILMAHGIPILPHEIRQAVKEDYSRFDRIFAMDQGNRYDLIGIFRGDPEGKITLLMDLCGEKRGIADPFNTLDYENTYRDIDKACDALVAQLLEEEKHEQGSSEDFRKGDTRR